MKEQRKRNRKRWFAILLSVVFCFTLLPTTAMAKANVPKNNKPNRTTHLYDEDWVYWCQGASYYGGQMQESGCRVVAQAKLLRETGIITAPTSEFNPDTYINWAWENEYFGNKNKHFTKYIGENKLGQAPAAYAKTLGADLTYVGKKELPSDHNKKVQTVMDYINRGYYVILGSVEHHAYVHRGKTLENGTPYIADSCKDYSYYNGSLLPYQTYHKTDLGKDFVFTNIKVYEYKAPANAWTVTFDARGGSFTKGSSTAYVEKGKNIGTLPTVTKSSATFEGWYTSDGKTKISSNQKITANTTFIAKWKEKQLIANGTYTLTPKSGPIHMKLDVNGASKDKGANVQIYAANNSDAQKFIFKHLENNYYTITNKASGKVLDVQDGNKKPGTNVQQWNANKTDAQKWKISSAGDGYYYLSPALDESLALDVNNSGQTNKTNVLVWTNKATDNQKWKIQKISEKDYYVKNTVKDSLAINADANTKNQIGQIPPAGKITIDTTIKNGKWWYGNYNGTSGYVFSDYLTATKPSVKALIKNGTYELSPKHAPGMRLDVAGASTSNKANIQIFKAHDHDAQKFTFKHLGDNYYSITNINSGKVLDVTGGSAEKGTNVQQYGWADVPAQRWKATDAGNGYFYLSPDTNENLVLDVNNFGKTNNTNVLVWTNCATDNQKWKLTKTTVQKENNNNKGIIKDGTYEVAPSHATGMRLDVSGASKDNKANVQIYNSNGTDAQKFKFKHLGNDYYSITCKASGKVLDLTGGKNANGTNVQQYGWSDVPAQRWKITKADNGYYYICSDVNEKLVLDVQDRSKSSGANVQVWENCGNSNQKWKLF